MAMATDQSTIPVTGRRRRPWLRLLLVLICLALLVMTIRSLGPGRVLDVARNANPFWLALSTLAVCSRFLIWGIKWCRILRREENVPYWPSLRILLAGSFANLTTPTAKLAGGVLRAALLKTHYGWRMPVAYGRALADQGTSILGTFLLFGVLAVGASFSAPLGEWSNHLRYSGLAVLGVLAVGLSLRGYVWKCIQLPAPARWLNRSIVARLFKREPDESAGNWIEPVCKPFLAEGPLWRTILPDIMLSALSFATLCLANALVFRALGFNENLLLIGVAVVLGYFAGILVGFWGGVGVTEVALTELYIRFGLFPEAAAAGTLLHRAIFYGVILLWGGISLLRASKE
jgi:uncharacterized membrane protein YbhN (UPF0104 family)